MASAISEEIWVSICDGATWHCVSFYKAFSESLRKKVKTTKLSRHK